jgi:hypothetical protein
MLKVRLAGRILLFAGAALLLAAILGNWTRLGRYRSAPPRPWERFSPELAARTPDLDALFAEAQARAGGRLAALPPDRAMAILFDVTAERFTHGDESTYGFFGNWTLRALAPLKKGGRFFITDADMALRYGHSALCDEIAFVLMQLAGKSGIPSRLAQLGGHVIMEAGYDNGWHAYDPDMEVVVRDGAGPVLDVETLVREPERVRAAYASRGGAGYGELMAGIFASREDNRTIFLRAPGGSGSPGMRSRPGEVEWIGRYARFAIPAALIVSGGGILLAAKGKKS